MTTSAEQNEFSPEYQAKGALRVLLVDLLKYAYLPDAWEKDNRWTTAIRNHRYVMEKFFEDTPSLRYEVDLAFEQIYEEAVEEAEEKSGDYDHQYPEMSPWTLEQVLDEEYLPEPAVKQMPPLIED